MQLNRVAARPAVPPAASDDAPSRTSIGHGAQCACGEVVDAAGRSRSGAIPESGSFVFFANHDSVGSPGHRTGRGAAAPNSRVGEVLAVEVSAGGVGTRPDGTAPGRARSARHCRRGSSDRPPAQRSVHRRVSRRNQVGRTGVAGSKRRGPTRPGRSRRSDRVRGRHRRRRHRAVSQAPKVRVQFFMPPPRLPEVSGARLSDHITAELRRVAAVIPCGRQNRTRTSL